MANDADKLIYQNANTYRLHADNLRWTLLGGFAVFLAAVLGASFNDQTANALLKPSVTLLGFIVSLAYLFILAVQNWFYNLFARWVDDCETRLIKDERLRSLQEFARAMGSKITPFHPAFYFALILVGTCAYLLLGRTVQLVVVHRLGIEVPTWALLTCWIAGMVGYFCLLHYVFTNWNRLVFKPLLQRLSNLYQ